MIDQRELPDANDNYALNFLAGTSVIVAAGALLATAGVLGAEILHPGSSMVLANHLGHPELDLEIMKTIFNGPNLTLHLKAGLEKMREYYNGLACTNGKLSVFQQLMNNRGKITGNALNLVEKGVVNNSDAIGGPLNPVKSAENLYNGQVERVGYPFNINGTICTPIDISFGGGY